MKKIKPIKAIAVIKKSNPKINTMDIFPIKEKKGLICGKNEMIIEVEIKVAEK